MLKVVPDANLFKDAFISAQKANEEVFNASSSTEATEKTEEKKEEAKETDAA